MNGIIVGLDDSIHSCSALPWAIYEAAIRHLPLTVMTVVPEEIRPATTIYWVCPPTPRTTLTKSMHGRRSSSGWAR
jgi:hypothetical protein